MRKKKDGAMRILPLVGMAAMLLVAVLPAFAGIRPYEMDWAGRTADDWPPLCALTTGRG
jgi:hypothetical protein